MSSDRKMSVPSGMKQKRGKSPSSIIVIHDDPQSSCGTNNNNGNMHDSGSFNNTLSPLFTQSESSPNLSVDSSNGSAMPRKSSITSTGSDTDIKLLNSAVKRSQTESDINYQLYRRKSSVSDVDESFYGPDAIYLGPTNPEGSLTMLHRPVAIEEELYSKVNQLNGLVLLWRKRWKQQKDYTESLTKQIHMTEKECSNIVNSLKEVYNEKLKAARKDINKEILEKQKLDRDKKALEILYKRTIQEFQKEKEKILQEYEKQSEELTQGRALQNEARIHISDIKKELSKLKRENEKLVKHIAKMRAKVVELEHENKKLVETMEKGNQQSAVICNGECEYKLLFELAIEKMKVTENIVCATEATDIKVLNSKQRKESYKQQSDGCGYILKTDPDNPLLMTIIEKTDKMSRLGSEETSSSSIESIIFADVQEPCKKDPDVINGNSNSNPISNSIHIVNSKVNYESVLLSTQRQRAASTSSAESADHILVNSVLPNKNELLQVPGTDIKSRVDSSTSDSSVSIDSIPSEIEITNAIVYPDHPVLRKSHTIDSVDQRSTQCKHSNLSRRITWNASRNEIVSTSDSSNSSPALSPKSPDSVLLHVNNGTSTPQNANTSKVTNSLSGFEGLRGRRNGIIDMNRDITLQLQLGGKHGKKAKDIAGLLKRLSFSHGSGDQQHPQHGSHKDHSPNVKNLGHHNNNGHSIQHQNGQEKKQLISTMFSRKKTHAVND